jgi:predicted aspartyl protease
MKPFPYVTVGSIPAPLIEIDLRDPTESRELLAAPALVDSGCDRTVIPASWLQQLQPPLGQPILVAGLGGQVVSAATYEVRLRIDGQLWHQIEVVENAGENCALLGRDILNHYRILLDGPNLRLEIL